MRRFTCGTCTNEAGFDVDRCDRCGKPLGYFPPLRAIRALDAEADGYRTAGDPATWWRCLNHAWGCNWMIPNDTGDVWCTSCRLTRGRPDTANPEAVDAWSYAERVKRRLIDQLLFLRLPLQATSPTDESLVFDLLYLPDGAGATGHDHGVVTLDLRETNAAYRDDLRRQLGERYRTVIGHLRHEIGHHYWPVLVEHNDAIGEFRALFGDERNDYATALATHYGVAPTDPAESHISAYATVHPSEDWAETFAHYFHLRDGLETGGEHGLCPPTTSADTMTTMLHRWAQLCAGVNQIDVGLGHPPSYPFEITETVGTKLDFVHRQIRARNRPRPSLKQPPSDS